MAINRDHFTSLGAFLALAGSAVGLGNIWRFPYLVGENGGAAFILIYLGFAVLIGIPIMVSEFVIGRRSQANASGAFKALAPGTKWGLVGVMGVICSFIILSFYNVVGGWCVAILVNPLDLDFVGFSSNTAKPIIAFTIFLCVNSFIVMAGVKKGIERVSKIMMPILFLIIVFIAVYVLTLEGASTGVKYILKPDFSKVTGQTFLVALGQAFFSLSLGSGMVITYGSYVSRKDNIMRMVSRTVVADTCFALLASLAIIPAVFAFGISPSQGPGLVFVTLPHVFSQMQFGVPVAILFFTTLLIAAITSAMSLMEVLVTFVTEEFKIGRKKAVLLLSALLWILGCLCSMSQGVLADFTIFGKTIFDLFDYVTANIFMTVGGLLVLLFVGWKLGCKIFRAEISNEGTLVVPSWILDTLFFLIRFVAPVGVLIIIFASI